MTRSLSAVLFLLLTAATSRGDISKVIDAYQSMLNRGTGSVSAGPLSDMVSDEVANSPVSEFASAVPVVRQCLRSASPEMRREGLGLLMTYNARGDSAQLLEPYIDDLVRMLDDPAPEFRAGAAYVLGGAGPTPSDRSVRALAAHLNDKNNGPSEFEAIAFALLTARPADASIVRAVLAGVSKYPSDHLDASIIQEFANNGITCDEALAFIRAGFANPVVRPTSIQAVGRMPAAVLDTFTRELQSTLADPTADSGTKSAASYVLMHR